MINSFLLFKVSWAEQKILSTFNLHLTVYFFTLLLFRFSLCLSHSLCEILDMASSLQTPLSASVASHHSVLEFLFSWKLLRSNHENLNTKDQLNQICERLEIRTDKVTNLTKWRQMMEKIISCSQTYVHNEKQHTLLIL